MNPERDQFFRIGSGQTSLAQRVDKFAADIENAKCDELIGVQAADIFRFYLFGKGNIENCLSLSIPLKPSDDICETY